jgi:eukaryotic-like serine/threonine-protein kinase
VSEEIKPPPLNFAVIDGSAGYRAVLSSFLLTQWPNAIVEEVDPFAETLRGVGIVFGTNSDVILLGGIGTYAEACASLQRLLARETCPPVILMVARELEPQVDMLIAAGAASILFKDAFSKSSLIDTICRLLGTAADANTVARPALSAPALYSDTQAFGRFSFIANGQLHTLAIEHYRFVATISANNLAQVFTAEKISDRKRVVIKIPLTTPVYTVEARVFCERYKFITSLNGRNVVRYLDAGIADSWPYVVLEYLGDGDLRRRIFAVTESGSTPGVAVGIDPIEALQILHKLSIALATFHSGNFAHMDLKPENIFFRGDELVLIDFDISTRFGHIARNRVTSDVLGSPFYMSPEQGQGLAIDGRSDLYSAGVIFYEMLTGCQPYTGESAAQVIYKHVHDEIPLLPKRIRALQPLIDELMAKDRIERIASARELSTMLLPFLRGDSDAVVAANDTP